jgi:phosphopantothenoylcysteine decarboxylase / phosphopantothenate---cysteine ligase
MKILITSGPTRQYLDPVRFVSNASSGTMGRELAQAALDLGHDVVVVSGPVKISYPVAAHVIDVETTEQMLFACLREFPSCDGLIGAAAPCDYRPIEIANHKIRKTGQPLSLVLVETDDIVATLGQKKRHDQWTVGFALETEDAHFRAVTKLQKKMCDLVAVNSPQAIDAEENSISVLNPAGEVVLETSGSKSMVAKLLLDYISSHLIKRP